MTALTATQIADVAYRAGFRGRALANAVAVALAESSGDPKSHNAVPPDNSYGLWQINMIGQLGPARRAEFHLHSNDALLNPLVNARAAWSISSHGTNWRPWSTYTNGAYTHYLGKAAAAAAQATRTRGGTKAPAHPPAPSNGSHQPARGETVVLDLAELASLTRLFERASDDVRDARIAVRSIGDTTEAARLALPDRALANAIAASIELLEDQGFGLAGLADHLDRQALYASDVRMLAEQADANRNGMWSRAEARQFVARYGDKPTAAERAVIEALTAGRIVRKWTAPAKHPTKHPTTGSGGHDGGSARTQRVDRMPALAAKQHASEHNGDNITKYGAWYGNNGAPWCAQFVSWVFWHSGNKLPAIDSAKGFQSVPDAIRYARAHGELHTTPRPGDVFLYRDGEHTGIVTKVLPDGHFDTVEGNWSNQVSRLQRDAGDGQYYFWSPIK